MLLSFLLISALSFVHAEESAKAIPLMVAQGAGPLPLGLTRSGRDLSGHFPFNQFGHGKNHHGSSSSGHHGSAGHHGEGHHGANHVASESDSVNPPRLGRQDEDGQEDQLSNSILADAAAAGERCIEKVMMIEETEFDEQIECHHSYDEKCHTTYITDYEPQQEEDCDENFVKNCYIEYKTMAIEEPVEICTENMVRNCDKEGPEICETVYESECSTTYHEHEVDEDVPECRIMQVEKCRDVTKGYSTVEECDKWPKQVCTLETKQVKRYSPETQCNKVPREVCGPGACPIEPGPKECRTEKKTLVQEVPEETCNLTPRKVCKFVTKLVPILKPKENCVDIPKEVCTTARVNPRKVKRPVIKKWCYVPTEESGLAGLDVEDGQSGDGDNEGEETDGARRRSRENSDLEADDGISS